MAETEYIRGGSVHRVTSGSPIKTGSWRVFRPVLDQENCNNCKLCFWFCPDSCVIFEKDNIQIDYEYCKGCGICAYECPKEAITMEREEEES